MKIGTHFQFEPPAGWDEFSEGGRLIFRGPSGEELVVSSWFIDGPRNDPGFRAAEDRLLKDGITVLEESLKNPELVPLIPISTTPVLSSLPCWYTISRSTDNTVFFYQAILKVTAATMLVTLESPPLPESIVVFSSFLAEVHEAGYLPA